MEKKKKRKKRKGRVTRESNAEVPATVGVQIVKH